MASCEWKDLWAKASLQYATAVAARPGKVVACGWLFPACFFAVVLLVFGPPEIGTDFSAYLKTEGNVAYKNDAFDAAVLQEIRSMGHRAAIGSNRRLGEMVFPSADAEHSEEGAIDMQEAFAVDNGLLATLSDGRLLRSDSIQQTGEWYVSIYFRESNGYGLPTGANILTEAHLNKIREIENGIINLPRMESFCYKTPEGSCRRPISFTNFVFGTLKPRP
jgi:hypothetical protein